MLKIKIKQAKTETEIEKIRNLASTLFSHPVLPFSRPHLYFAAFQGKSLIGFAHLKISKKCAVLQGLGVDQKFQGKGIGSSLLDAAVKHCTRLGMSHILLKVKATNDPALRLYLKKGFSPSFVDSSVVMSYRPLN